MKTQLRNQYRALFIVGTIAIVLKMIINVSEAEVLAATGLLLSMCGIVLVSIAVCIARNIFKMENN